jgi:WS/DGAT/MGAT family acyltransferase
MSSEQLSALDAAWLHMDRPTNSMVIDIVLQCDDRVDEQRLAQALDERVIRRFRRFRQRVADPAVNLSPWTSPYWVDEPDVRAADHLRRSVLPPDGDSDALHQVLGRLCSRPLRADRPLWEVHLIDRDDTAARTSHGPGSVVLLRVHHAIGDGVALVQVLLSLTEPVNGSPDPRLLPIDDDDRPSVLPGVVGRAAHQALDFARRAGSRTRAVGDAVQAVLAHPGHVTDLSGYPRSQAATLAKLGFGLRAEHNRLQGPLCADKHRRWTADVALTSVKAAGRRSGGTINDLMMTSISGALREYLAAHHDVVPDLLVIMPVNLRPPGASIPAGLGNDFGLVFVPLPTAEPDRARRFTRLRAALDEVKAGDEAGFVHSMLEFMGQGPKAVQTAWTDSFAARATAIVTNVSGPHQAVSLAGAPVSDVVVWVPVTGPLGLGLSICSYAGRIRLGVAGDAELIPDLDRLVTLLDHEVAALQSTPTAG